MTMCGDFDIGKSVPPFCHCHFHLSCTYLASLSVSSCNTEGGTKPTDVFLFFSLVSLLRVEVGLEVSLGKNWLCSGGTAASKMNTRKEPAFCNLLINSKGTPLLIF